MREICQHLSVLDLDHAEALAVACRTGVEQPQTVIVFVAGDVGMAEEHYVDFCFFGGIRQPLIAEFDVVHMSVGRHEAHALGGEVFDHWQIGAEVAVALDHIIHLVGEFSFDLVHLALTVAAVDDDIGVAVQTHDIAQGLIRAVTVGKNDNFHIFLLSA